MNFSNYEEILSTEWKYKYAGLFIAEFFVFVKYWQQAICPYIEEWLNILQYTYTMEYHVEDLYELIRVVLIYILSYGENHNVNNISFL
jgi:hypothetical protein